ncbi:MAG: hypothetical protein NXI24_08675 [bacterium]|nr:hypothetical protein [bacterium]
MKKYLLYAGGLLVSLPLILTAVNIAQNGSSTPDGRTPAEILGVAVDAADEGHVAALSKSDVMQLFYALDAPAFADLDGEYRAVLVDVGVLSAGSAWFTHNVFGEGRWLGKGLSPIKDSGATAQRGAGYNLFADPNDSDTIQRMRRFDVSLGPSEITNGDSLHLNYSHHNGGLVHSMRDEIRKINDRLYLGMGHMALGGGAINPAPFLLIGPAERPVREIHENLD